MRLIILGICLLSLLTTRLFSNDYFLIEDIGTSAKQVGLGMIDGFDDSSSTMFSNPAGLYRVKNISMSVFSTTFIDQIEYRNITMGARTPMGVWALGYQEASVFDIAQTSSVVHSEPLGYFDYKSSVVKLGYQYSVKSWLHLGANLSYFTQSFSDVYGQGTNLDIGAIAFYHRIEFSAALRNILTFSDVQYGEGVKEDLPLRGSLGVRVPIYDFDLYAQYHQKQSIALMSAGIEYRPSFFNYLTVFSGYRQYEVLSKVSNNLTFGVGLRLLNVGFSYAYERSDHFEFDHKNYFSVDVNF